MGKILGAYLCPHPPIIVPEVGRGSEKDVADTIKSMRWVAKDIKEKSPDTIIVITPHGPAFYDAVSLSQWPVLKGDLSAFRAPEVSFEYENNTLLAKKILELSQEYETTCISLDDMICEQYNINRALDHGTVVPLYFISKEYKDFKILHISIGFLPYEELYAFGKVIQHAVEECGDNAVVLASGDLSHKLTPNAPAGYDPAGAEFDEKLVGLLKKRSVDEIITMDKQLVEKAGECGLRPIDIMLGTLDGYEFQALVLSYEGPFGVGYCVARFEPKAKTEERCILKKILETKYTSINGFEKTKNPYVDLAKRTVDTYIRTGKIPRIPSHISGELLNNRAGVFVSIKNNNQLRGCIGTIQPIYENIAQEIINNAISASTRDYRFEPVKEDELEELQYSVDVLREPEPIQSLEELDVKRYGVIVKSGDKKGLLLPDLEGVDTVECQVEIALRKAGIGMNESYTLERFEIERHGE